MADIYMDVNANLAEVPVNVMPLLSDSDFKTIQTSVAYNAAGMALKWNFVDSAGNTSSTAVTPTTGGVYDWAHQAGGMYTIEIPASGGVSANNNAAGYGWFSGVATGILPWRGPIIGFRAAALNDSLMDTNTTGLVAPTVAGRTLVVDAAGLADANVVKLGPTGAGTAQTARDVGASVLLSNGTGTGQVSLSSGAVKIQTALKTNQALSKYEFLMTDSTNHNPATGKTVTVTRSINGAAFAATTAGTATELANGIYYIDLSAADLNGTVVTLRMTATGCDDLFTSLILEP